MSLTIGSLFSGYGGLDLAVESGTGATPAWFVEFDAAPSKILAHHWPDVPNYGDVTKVRWEDMPPVDIITGGTPCQDLSAAGKRAGMTEGTRSNLWVNMREAINIIRPRLVVWENVQGALSAKAASDSDMEQDGRPLGDGGGGHLRALGRVLGDLAEIGYDAQWTTIRASDVGAPHHRARVFLIAWPQEVPNSEGGGWDHGQATHDGQADREVHSPRHDSDTAADAGCAAVWEQSAGSSAEEAGPEACNRSSDPRRERSPRDGRDSGAADSSGGTGSVSDGDDVCPRRDEGRLRPSAGRGDVPADSERHHGGAGAGEGSGGQSPLGATAPGGPQHGCGAGDVRVGNAGGEAPSHPDGERRHGRNSGKGETGRGQPTDDSGVRIEWGNYAPAVRRWERITRPAPAPTELNTRGNPRLSAAFAEWMMGLPSGWVTDVPGLSRADQLKAIGNGVCPQQAEAAIAQLLPRVERIEVPA